MSDFTQLGHDRRHKLAELAITLGLPDRRERLLDGLPPGLCGALKDDPRPTDQLRADLVALDAIPALDDGRVPVEIWLRNAERLLRSERRPEARRFAAARSPITRRRKRKPLFAAAIVFLGLIGGAGWLLWPGPDHAARLRDEGWIAVQSGARAPAPGDLMAQVGDDWERIADRCGGADAARAVPAADWGDAERRVLAAADFEAAPSADAACIAALTGPRRVQVVLETIGPAAAPDRAWGWRGRLVEVSGWHAR